MEHWRCIAGCGACCRLDPALRGEDLERLDPEQRRTYLAMVGPDGWCIHFDTGGRRCRIYDSRPDFCRVDNLVALFGEAAAGHGADALPTAPARDASDPGAGGGASAVPVGALPMDLEAQALAIACCRQQIRAEYGGRGRVMRRFERAIRRQP